MRIFISYRREDAAAYAGRLYDRLCKHFGREQVFIDVDAIQPGDDFAGVIEERIALCDVIVVLIGIHWLACTDAGGQRRIDSPDDFVRLEIAAALKRNVRLIPTLVGGATMPPTVDLPDPMRPIARRQAVTIDDFHFHDDIDRLVKSIRHVRGAKGGKLSYLLPRHTLGRLSLIAVPLFAAGLVLGLFWLQSKRGQPPEVIRSGNAPIGAPETASPELWTGNWYYVCDTLRGTIRGEMLIKTEKSI